MAEQQSSQPPAITQRDKVRALIKKHRTDRVVVFFYESNVPAHLAYLGEMEKSFTCEYTDVRVIGVDVTKEDAAVVRADYKVNKVPATVIVLLDEVVDHMYGMDRNALVKLIDPSAAAK